MINIRITHPSYTIKVLSSFRWQQCITTTGNYRQQ